MRTLVSLLLGMCTLPLACAADNPKGCFVKIVGEPGSSDWPTAKRLLIFTTWLCKAQGEDGVYSWTYLPDGPAHATFNPNNGQNYRQSTLTSLDFPSQKEDEDKVQVKLTKADGSVCKDLKPLNLTYPRYFKLAATEDGLPPPAGSPKPPPDLHPTGKIVRTQTLNGDSPNLSPVLNEGIIYTIKDQFDTIITTSVRNNNHVMTKETVTLKVTNPAVFLPPDTMPDYATNDDGEQTDQLRLVTNLSSYKDSLGLFSASWKGKVVAQFNTTHDWFTSVNKKHPTQVTANTVTVVVSNVSADRKSITFTTTYTVVPK